MGGAQLYIQIVNLIFYIIFGIYIFLIFHFVIFGVIGAFKKKKFPNTDKINNYGIVIPARNEEKVIANLIESIKANKYPQEKLHIFVVAHNCTDKTAEIARNHGATVYEYNNKEEATKGFGLKYFFETLKKNENIKIFDGFYIFDADNIVSDNFFEKMNDAFEFYDHKYIINSLRSCKNFGENLLADWYGINFGMISYTWSRGRTVCNCSTRITGTGYLMPTDVIEDGWNYFSLTEDIEFSVDQICKGRKIAYVDEAVFYDEQPTSFKFMWRQRLRWERGHLVIFVKKIGFMLKTLFSKKTQNKGSVYDIIFNCLPFCLILFLLTFFRYLLLFISPAFGANLTEILIHWETIPNNPFYELIKNLFLNQDTGIVFIFIKDIAINYLGFFFLALLVIILGRKTFPKVSFWRKVLIVFTWPFYMFLQVPLDICSLFVKNLTWKTIPHDDSTTIQEINENKEN